MRETRRSSGNGHSLPVIDEVGAWRGGVLVLYTAMSRKWKRYIFYIGYLLIMVGVYLRLKFTQGFEIYVEIE